jgi:hypothetical protein
MICNSRKEATKDSCDNSTEASGQNSFASGTKTIANASSQSVFGKFNIADISKAQIVGLGRLVNGNLSASPITE